MPRPTVSSVSSQQCLHDGSSALLGCPLNGKSFFTIFGILPPHHCSLHYSFPRILSMYALLGTNFYNDELHVSIGDFQCQSVAFISSSQVNATECSAFGTLLPVIDPTPSYPSYFSINRLLLIKY